MSKVLNQDEVDALLDVVQSEKPQSSSPASQEEEGRGYKVVPAEGVQTFDFKRPERISREQVAALETLHEDFCKDVSAYLSAQMRTPIEVRLVSVEQFTYAEFIMSIPNPTFLNQLSCPPLEGSILLELNPSIAFPFIDRHLGGESFENQPIDRPFTLIEKGLVNSILSKILVRLQEAWEAVQPLRFQILDSESNPALLQIVPPNEPVILLSFETLMGEQSGMLNLCIPFKVIEPIAEKLSLSRKTTPPRKLAGSREERLQLLHNLLGAPLNVSVILAEVSISLTDLLTLRPGDILDCQVPVDSELVLCVEQERPLRGKPGIHRQKNAVLITRESPVQRSTPAAAGGASEGA